MKKTMITVLGYLLICVALLSSCSNDEEKHPELERTDVGWGYFKGDINGTKVSLENNWNNRSILSGRSAYYLFGEWKVMPDSINIMGTLVHYNESSELRITLYDLTPGERYLVLPEREYWYENCINVTIFSDSEKKKTKAFYIPNTENPFRVEILDVQWLSFNDPVIEVKLDGVLYNTENKKDAIVINGTYGTR